MKQHVNRLIMHRKKGFARPILQNVGNGVLAHAGTSRSLKPGAPTYVEGVVQDAADNVVIIDFTESLMSLVNDYGLGFTVKNNAVPVGINTSNLAPADDHRIFLYTNHQFITGEVITLSYDDTVGDITDRDDTPHPLVSFTDQPVTNNVLP